MTETKYVYLDYAATTPMDPRVIEEINNHFKETYGNTSSLHSIGQRAGQILEQSRKTVADLINADRQDIIFTSSGTEADNIAITGVILKNMNRGKHIITSSIEHHAVENPCKQWEKDGFKVTWLPVDKYGLINLKDLEIFSNDGKIVVADLIKCGKIREGGKIKILGEGEIKQAYTVQTHFISKKAKQAIETAGGKVELI